MLITVTEVVRRCTAPLTEGQVRTAIQRRELEVTRVGRKVFVDPADVEKRFGVAVRAN
jgi:hypothetical protein